jgi:hypothetical protein
MHKPPWSMLQITVSLIGTTLASLGIVTAVDGAVMEINALEVGGFVMIVLGALAFVLALNVD